MSSLALPRELNFVANFLRDNHRPFKWRTVMQIDMAIPRWAANYEVSKIDHAARLVPVDDLGPTDLPRPSLDRSTVTFPLVEFGAGYFYGDRELERAAALKMNPQTERAMANVRASEQFLDQVGASGDPYSKGLPGLGNSPDVTPTVAITKTGGGTIWSPAALADELLQDLHNLINAVSETSLETHTPDTIILPQAQFNTLSRLPLSRLCSCSARSGMLGTLGMRTVL